MPRTIIIKKNYNQDIASDTRGQVIFLREGVKNCNYFLEYVHNEANVGEIVRSFYNAIKAPSCGEKQPQRNTYFSIKVRKSLRGSGVCIHVRYAKPDSDINGRIFTTQREDV